MSKIRDAAAWLFRADESQSGRRFNLGTGTYVDTQGRVVPPPGDGASRRPHVSERTAYSIPAWFRCSSVIACSIAQLERIVVDKKGMPVSDQPDFWLLDDPDPDYTWFELVEGTVYDVLNQGNALWSPRVRDMDSVPASVWFVPWSRVSVGEYSNSDRIGWYRFYGEQVDPWNAMHFRGPRMPPDPLGMNVIHWYAKRMLGHHLALDNASLSAVVDGTNAGGHLEGTDPHSEEIAARVDKAWQSGPAGSGKPFYLGDGMKYVPHRRDPTSLQLIEGRRYGAIEVCVFMGVHPHVAGVPVAESSTYSNALMDASHFVRFTLSGWLSRMEAVISRQLPQGLRMKFDVSRLLVPDFAERMKAYADGVAAQVLLPNEARGREGLEALDGGDMFPAQKQMEARQAEAAALGAAGEQAAEEEMEMADA